MGHLVQMAGLAVQNFVSAAVGIAVAVALVRGFARAQTNQLGNFWVDLVRIPAAGRVGWHDRVHRRRHGAEPVGRHRCAHPGRRHPARHRWPGGVPGDHQGVRDERWRVLQRQQRAPVREPDHWTNWLEIFLLLAISFSLPRASGRMVRDDRQGYAIAIIMGILAIGSVITINALQVAHHGTVPQAVGAATEGVETRFGVAQSATFASATTDVDRRGGLVP
jgi:K+-transporting ATPase ATPase A chain